MIRIICFGKIKEEYLKNLIQDYQKRIAKYHSIEIVELKDENILEKEEQSLLKVLKKNEYIITLEIEGKSYTSEEFASQMDSLFIKTPCITFIIGSSLGLSDNIKRRANEHISFSKFTFPHGLFRGILLEQIYRAFKIINKETYHK